MTSNPTLIQVGNTTIQAYHGKSFDDWIKKNHQLDYTKPCNIMTQQLEKRHLAPIYGETTPNCPEKEDNLIINPVPDIIHTGHIHITQYKQYKGIHLLNSGTYQDQTSFQKLHMLRPTTGLTPILKNGKISLKQF